MLIQTNAYFDIWSDLVSIFLLYSYIVIIRETKKTKFRIIALILLSPFLFINLMYFLTRISMLLNWIVNLF